MQTQLTQIGDSLAVVLPPEIRDRFNLVSGDTLEITAADSEIKLTVPPVVVDDKQDIIALAIHEADQKYGETFRRLAE